jgi:hypothetical protein
MTCNGHSASRLHAFVPASARLVSTLRSLDGASSAGLPLFAPRRDPVELLTMIITTSVIPSHPDTRMIETVLSSYSLHEPLLANVRKIIVADAPKRSLSGKRYARARPLLEAGSP